MSEEEGGGARRSRCCQLDFYCEAEEPERRFCPRTFSGAGTSDSRRTREYERSPQSRLTHRRVSPGMPWKLRPEQAPLRTVLVLSLGTVPVLGPSFTPSLIMISG